MTKAAISSYGSRMWMIYQYISILSKFSNSGSLIFTQFWSPKFLMNTSLNSMIFWFPMKGMALAEYSNGQLKSADSNRCIFYSSSPRDVLFWWNRIQTIIPKLDVLFQIPWIDILKKFVQNRVKSHGFQNSDHESIGRWIIVGGPTSLRSPAAAFPRSPWTLAPPAMAACAVSLVAPAIKRRRVARRNSR